MHQLYNLPHYIAHQHLCGNSTVSLSNLAVFATSVDFLELCQFQAGRVFSDRSSRRWGVHTLQAHQACAS